MIGSSSGLGTAVADISNHGDEGVEAMSLPRSTVVLGGFSGSRLINAILHLGYRVRGIGHSHHFVAPALGPAWSSRIRPSHERAG
jgi:hypothetical protein